MKNIIVAQVGSRHRYAIPKIFDDNNMLCALYTDSTKYSFLGRLASVFSKSGSKNKFINRLASRDPKINRKKIFTSDQLIIKKKIANFQKKDLYTQQYIHYMGMNNTFKKWGLRDADCIYNMYFENIEFLKLAKQNNKKIVIDIYDAPITYKYLLQEIENLEEYPMFKSYKEAYLARYEIREKYMNEALQLADYYTIPSKFVLKSMNEYSEFSKEKAVIIPYGSSLTTNQYSYQPVKGRIIWVGGDSLRKGLVYYSKAAKILKKKYPYLDFRVIGETNPNIVNSPLFNHLNFLGVLNKEDLTNEYKTAEVYVFPTLSEGFAGTIIEAANFACPIITTECAGTNVDEFPAIYVPVREVNPIVEGVEKIINDANYRDTLSRKTYEYAKSLSPENYANKLLEFFKNI